MKLPYLLRSLLLSAAPLLAQDPFLPFLDHAAVPKDTLSTENMGSGASAITVRKFTFASRNGVNTVYAILAQPQQAGNYPAILFLHGGGSRAEDMAGYAREYATRGYVGLAIDLPGICGTTNTPNSSGPWKNRPLGEAPRFDMGNGGTHSTLLDAEAAGLEAFNWLRAQPNVKADAMGINGQSWGGYSTTLLSGLLGAKVKAAYSVFGCGFYDAGSLWKKMIFDLAPADRAAWLATYDAGRRAPGMKAAYFLEGASNDTYVWPPAVTATLQAVPGAKNQAWGPSRDHSRMATANTMQRLWFDYHLKGLDKPFPTTSVSRQEAAAGGAWRITVQVNLPAGLALDSVQVYHSVPDTGWTKRDWDTVVASAATGGYTATLPAPPAGKIWDYWAQSWDNRGVATASPMQNTGTPVVFINAKASAKVFTAVNTPVRADGRRISAGRAGSGPFMGPAAGRLHR
jgi:dienelactone hydrolase